MILQSSEYPFMLADLDGVIKEDGKMCIFEAKTASAYKQEIWEKGVPEAYILQVQHYMAVTGAEKAYVAALVGGNRFYRYEVLRDDALIEKNHCHGMGFLDESCGECSGTCTGRFSGHRRLSECLIWGVQWKYYRASGGSAYSVRTI